MTISQKDFRLLYQRSGNRCAFPGCSRVLDEPATEFDEAVPLSEVAHIVASRPDGPRGWHWLPIEERDKYENLILLCEQHHHIVDGQPQTYAVERLRQFKADHEAQMRQATGRAVESQAEVSPHQPFVTEVVYSTLLPVLALPESIYTVPCRFRDGLEKDAAKQVAVPRDKNEVCPFVLRSGLLICFQNLANRDGPFRDLVAGNWDQVRRYKSRAWWGDPNRERWFVELLNRSLNKLTGRKGLNWDRRHKRYYFQAQAVGEPLEISYKPLNRSMETRQVVWQPVTRKTGLPKSYWLHRAVSLRFDRVTREAWCLSIRPEFHVTSDGRLPYVSDLIGAKVTRKKARMFNYDLLAEVHFWRDFLGGSQPRIMLSFGPGQHLVISTTPLQTQVEWPGIPEEFAKPFTNVEYEENLFTLAELIEIEDEGLLEASEASEGDASEFDDDSEELFS